MGLIITSINSLAVIEENTAFSSPYTIVLNDPYNLAFYDINGDGWKDIIYVERHLGSDPATDEIGTFNGGGDLFALLNDQNNGFSEPVSLNIRDRISPRGLILFKDLNQDNLTDLILYSRSFGVIKTYLNAGNNQFEYFSYVTAPAGSHHDVFIADVNNDNYQDVVLGGANFENSELFLGQSDFTFSSSSQIASTESTAIDLLDFNNDQILDLITYIPNTIPNTFAVHLGNNDGTFEASQSVEFNTLVASTVGTIIANDLNADGLMDLVTSTGTAFYLHLQNQTGFESVYTPVGTHNHFAMGDLGEDSGKEIVLASATNYDGQGYGVGIKAHCGNGAYTEPGVLRTNLQNQGWRVFLEDINNDNLIDIIQTSADGGKSIVVFYNQDFSSWASAACAALLPEEGAASEESSGGSMEMWLLIFGILISSRMRHSMSLKALIKNKA